MNINRRRAQRATRGPGFRASLCRTAPPASKRKCFTVMLQPSHEYLQARGPTSDACFTVMLRSSRECFTVMLRRQGGMKQVKCPTSDACFTVILRPSCCGQSVSTSRSCCGQDVSAARSCCGQVVCVSQSCDGQVVSVSRSCCGQVVSAARSCCGQVVSGARSCCGQGVSGSGYGNTSGNISRKCGYVVSGIYANVEAGRGESTNTRNGFASLAAAIIGENSSRECCTAMLQRERE